MKQVQMDRSQLLRLLIEQCELMLHEDSAMGLEIGLSALEIIATDMEVTELKCFEWILDIVMENEYQWEQTVQMWVKLMVAARYMKHKREGGK